MEFQKYDVKEKKKEKKERKNEQRKTNNKEDSSLAAQQTAKGSPQPLSHGPGQESQLSGPKWAEPESFLVGYRHICPLPPREWYSHLLRLSAMQRYPVRESRAEACGGWRRTIPTAGPVVGKTGPHGFLLFPPFSSVQFRSVAQSCPTLWGP